MSDQPDFEQDDTPDELLPLSVGVDMLDDVVKLLNQVDDLVTQHRRAASDDPRALEQLQHATMRINQAWGSVVSARKVLRGKHGQ
jgi:hypothetical protein